MVITIDGPGGVGKSTVARELAATLQIGYLDTGAYYRAVTVAVLAAAVPPDDGAAVAAVADAAELGYRDGRMLLDGRDVSDRIRTPEVTAAVSAVAANPEVRETVVRRQRRWVADRGGEAVVEGRDIGTVVFPDAPVKVFLTADPEVRARRRAGDAETAGSDVAIVEEDLRRRDHADSTRDTSPLVPAADAVTIDTSHLTVEEVVGMILGMAAEATAEQVD